MRETFCPICNTPETVLRYEKDDPVLSCGHQLLVEMACESLSDVFDQATRDHAIKLMKEEKITFKQAYQKVLLMFNLRCSM